MDIWETNEKGEYIKEMWRIEAVTNTEIKKVVYGNPPKGYKETMKALSLKTDTFYHVRGMYFFRLKRNGNILLPEVYNYKEFNKSFSNNDD